MSEINKIIKRWIEKADHDLGTAIITNKYIPKYKDTVAFHCQQAVEKYLKSYIIKLGLKINRTHDLVFLFEQIKKVDKIEYYWFEKVFELQDFAIEIRYPDQTIELSAEDIELAIKTAYEFRSMKLRKLKIDIAFDDFEINSGS